VDECGKLYAGGKSELAVDVSEVRLDGLRRDEKSRSGFDVREPGDHSVSNRRFLVG
jgi:hypothetical protein